MDDKKPRKNILTHSICSTLLPTSRLNNDLGIPARGVSPRSLHFTPDLRKTRAHARGVETQAVIAQNFREEIRGAGAATSGTTYSTAAYIRFNYHRHHLGHQHRDPMAREDDFASFFFHRFLSSCRRAVVQLVWFFCRCYTRFPFN